MTLDQDIDQDIQTVREAIRFSEEYGYNRWQEARDTFNAIVARLSENVEGEDKAGDPVPGQPKRSPSASSDYDVVREGLVWQPEVVSGPKLAALDRIQAENEQSWNDGWIVGRNSLLAENERLRAALTGWWLKVAEQEGGHR